MTNVGMKITEVRFVVEDEAIHAFVLLVALGDTPKTNEGWRHQSFDGAMTMGDVLLNIVAQDLLTWEVKPPYAEKRK